MSMRGRRRPSCASPSPGPGPGRSPARSAARDCLPSPSASSSVPWPRSPAVSTCCNVASPIEPCWPGWSGWSVIVVVATAHGGPSWLWSALLGLALGAGPLLAVHLITPAGIGFGDVKLAAVLGGLLGVVHWILALLMLGLASVVALGGVAMLPTWRRSIPFGLCLGVAAVLSIAGAGLARAVVGHRDRARPTSRRRVGDARDHRFPSSTCRARCGERARGRASRRCARGPVRRRPGGRRAPSQSGLAARRCAARARVGDRRRAAVRVGRRPPRRAGRGSRRRGRSAARTVAAAGGADVVGDRRRHALDRTTRRR